MTTVEMGLESFITSPALCIRMGILIPLKVADNHELVIIGKHLSDFVVQMNSNSDQEPLDPKAYEEAKSDNDYCWKVQKECIAKLNPSVRRQDDLPPYCLAYGYYSETVRRM